MTSIYDYIIAGGGASGLSLAYMMAQTNLRERSILIVDRDAKEQNDRTWCFWTPTRTPLDHLVYRSWDQAEVVSDQFRQVYDLRPYQYKMIRGIDFYQGMREALSPVPGITFMKGRVTEVSDTKDPGIAQVSIDGIPYGAKYVFDSTFSPKDFLGGPARYHYLMQHFKGWEIETPADTFDPHTVTLFDFRTPQKGCMRFFYILPFTKRRAMVEYTLFSAQALKPHEYDRAIADYLENILLIPKYRIASTEMGIIPMTDCPFPRRLGKRILAIGTKGGRVKPSSGYAFLRIQRDTLAIISSLINEGHPFNLQGSSTRYRLFDSLMLEVMQNQGDQMKAIFIQLFKKNSIQDIFRFLDEEATLTENIRLISSLPRKPFLQALFRVKLLQKV